ncbi:MAG: flotillin family protein, partial [Prochloraceae cyanobacterium]
ILFLLSIWAYTRVYVITPNNEAFVRTGGVFVKKKTVILNGGCVVLPGFHEITRVPLREISIDVERTGKLAVRTQDYLRANMRVTFYVCINAKEEDVLISAARLSKQGRISENDIKEALEKRADDAIRAAAKRKSIAEIDSDKLGFADEVLNLIQQDLKKVGLTLNNIAISEIEESDTYDENNFFDAQGVKLRTETIQRSIKQKLDVELKNEQEKKELELTTKVAIEQRQLEAEKQSLAISEEKEEAKLNQQKQIEFLKAQQAREIQEAQDQETAKIERNKILQEKAVEEEKIEQQLALQQNQIDADIALEERNKAFKIAQTLQKQEAEVAEITRQKTVEASRLKSQIEIAEAEKDSKVAQQEAAIGIAERTRDRLAAEAEKAQAEAAVVTATEIEKAEREQRLSVIAAQQEAQQSRIKEQNVVEIDVFRRKRQAEIARQAAELESQSIRTLAEANRYKALAEAEGKKALIQAENALSNANRTAELVKAIWPDLVVQMPEIVQALAPQPGILGDARIYAFPGASGNNGNGASNASEISKLLLSTSGLSLLDTLLDEGKLGKLASQIKQLLSSDSTISSEVSTTVKSASESPSSEDSEASQTQPGKAKLHQSQEQY